MLISIKKQHLYFSWLFIPGIQFRFWASLIHVEHCSMIPLIRLCDTLSWSRHQNMVTLVQFGCKGNIWSSCFHSFMDWDIMFPRQYHAGLEEMIHIVLAP